MKIFAAILLVLVVLLSIRINFSVKYTDSLSVELKILCFKIKLYPRKKKSKKTEKKSDTKQKNKDAEKKSKEKKVGIHGFLEVISTFLEAAKGISGIVKKHLIIKKLSVKIAVSDEDASQTAVRYGEICAAVYPALAFFTSLFTTKDYDVDIRPDFTGNNIRVSAYADIYMRTVFVIGAAISLLFKYIKIMADKDNKKAVLSNGNASH